MYVKIGTKDYSKIKSLSFAPEVDLTGASLPANEFSCQIETDDVLTAGHWASLYDDNDVLWAKYWIIYAEKHMDAFWSIKAQSIIARLDRFDRDLELYQAEPVTNVLASIFLGMPQGCYALDSAFSSATISGYCPEQTARERLLWVCFVLGAYIKDFFSDKINIVPIGSTQSTIPLEDTYWRPSTTYMDYVTSIRVRAYIYEPGTPETTDDWISDGSSEPTYYIETTQDFTLTNNNVPEGSPENEVVIDEVKLVNTTNATDILSYLALYYFNRAQVNLGCIDNAAHMPGQKVYGYTSKQSMVEGYIEKVAFTFGKQAKGSLVIAGVGGEIDVDSVVITVLYKYGNIVVSKREYRFPEGGVYSIENKFIDQTLNGHRYIFRPTHSTISGTATADTTITEPMSVALDYFQNILHIVSVDDSTEGTAGEVEIS